MIDSITVVAVFVAVIFGGEVGTDHPVPAASEGAVGQTSVFIDSVPIITSFAGLHDPITAGGGATFVAGIIGIFITVVAAFARTDHPVAADVHAAVGFTGVFIHSVAVIASLVARLLGA